MSDGGRLLWIVGVFAAATLGILIGIWIGGQVESSVYEALLTNADLPEECWEKIMAGAENLVREFESKDMPAPAPAE